MFWIKIASGKTKPDSRAWRRPGRWPGLRRSRGGRQGFGVRFDGTASLSPALKSLVGACLARFAESLGPANLDVRFEGIDGGPLVVFGELAGIDEEEAIRAESRLHRAALVSPADD